MDSSGQQVVYSLKRVLVGHQKTQQLGAGLGDNRPKE